MAGYEFTGVSQSSESDEVGREAPDEVEMADCDACGEERPPEGGMNVEVNRTYVDNMLVSVEEDWICAECRFDLEETLLEQQIARKENQYYYEK